MYVAAQTMQAVAIMHIIFIYNRITVNITEPKYSYTYSIYITIKYTI